VPAKAAAQASISVHVCRSDRIGEKSHVVSVAKPKPTPPSPNSTETPRLFGTTRSSCPSPFTSAVATVWLQTNHFAQLVLENPGWSVPPRLQGGVHRWDKCDPPQCRCLQAANLCAGSMILPTGAGAAAGVADGTPHSQSGFRASMHKNLRSWRSIATPTDHRRCCVPHPEWLSCGTVMPCGEIRTGLSHLLVRPGRSHYRGRIPDRRGR
jgi:hypothetical protein